ncbi:MAG TPA: GNAT family N-acetyltransferase [Saprospiraceae bacterium]|nr:GNAT family N-acetyltransferase [Saprospiraceae bacterium]
MIIRFLNKQDATFYSQLKKMALQESLYAFSDSFQDEINKSLVDYENEIEMKGVPLEKFALGAFSDSNQLIGFVKFTRDQRTKARHRSSLHSLYIAPEYRNIGIAKLLMNELIAQAKLLPDLEQLQLSVIISPKYSVVKFYELFDFKILGSLIVDDLIIEGNYVDAVNMVKYLKQDLI